MKLSVTQENLHRALATVSRIVGSSTTLPVLSNVLLGTDGTRLKLSGTNLELGINYWIGAKVEKPGSITVPARLLNEFIANLPSQAIKLELDKNSLKLESDNFSSSLNGIDPEEFPSIPEVKKGTTLKIPASDFKAAAMQVVVVASSDDARPVLNGVYLFTEGQTLVLAATDSYRLAEKKIKLNSSPAKKINAIIPARTINEIIRIIEGQSENIEITIGENQAQFKIGEAEIISRLIEGEFPDYQKLIPDSAKTSFSLPTSELNGLTKIASLFAAGSGGSITVKVKDAGELEITSVANQVGENTSKAQVTLEGEPAELSLNSRYLLDALSVVGTENVKISITGKVNPCLITPTDKKDYLHIIMPLRS